MHAGQVRLQLWRNLRQTLNTDPEHGKQNYHTGSATHRKKVRLWQALAILSADLPEQELEGCIAACWRVCEVCWQHLLDTAMPTLPML